MLAQIAAEDALAQYAALFEAAARRPVQNETPKERYQLAVPPQYRFDRRQRQRPVSGQKTERKSGFGGRQKKHYKTKKTAQEEQHKNNWN